ncbi:hypothetical protein HW555_013634 [Spodoptera exigua]|uniref:GAG-pre-integrase domain-containing protein n=1 Tax=Spodoptera exigua TaxID=7107 RepID=A0A835G3R3_SPOEX|nr:hypothetical protein HW555_013634 [Spodoptera exigua]
MVRASEHMCRDRGLFTSFTNTKNESVIIGNGAAISVLGYGQMAVEVFDGTNWINTTINKVLFVPELKTNLFSVNCASDKGYVIVTDDNSCKFYKNNKVCAIAKRVGSSYYLELRYKNKMANVAKNVKTTLQEWHERLAHQNYEYVRKVLSKNNIDVKETSVTKCESCLQGKIHRLPFGNSETVTTKTTSEDLAETTSSSLDETMETACTTEESGSEYDPNEESNSSIDSVVECQNVSTEQCEPVNYKEAMMRSDTSGVSQQTKSSLKRPADSESNIEFKKNRPPSDSIQSVFTKPGFETNSKLSYNECDRAPFTVFVSKIEPDPAAGSTLKVLKFAQFLHKNNIKGITEGGIKSLGPVKRCKRWIVKRSACISFQCVRSSGRTAGCAVKTSLSIKLQRLRLKDLTQKKVKELKYQNILINDINSSHQRQLHFTAMLETNSEIERKAKPPTQPLANKALESTYCTFSERVRLETLTPWKHLYYRQTYSLIETEN